MIFIKIISHRGSNVSIYKPNTKEALLEALQDDYIDGIEFDVRITKDKKIVIIHDLLINFISNGKGIVKKMKLNKLLKYNFGTNKLKQKICTLDELLKKIKS
ncbi:MAG: glycerophosphodiester phosphodiesterase family protein, partial [Bacilli bacterium]